MRRAVLIMAICLLAACRKHHLAGPAYSYVQALDSMNIAIGKPCLVNGSEEDTVIFNEDRSVTESYRGVRTSYRIGYNCYYGEQYPKTGKRSLFIFLFLDPDTTARPSTIANVHYWFSYFITDTSQFAGFGYNPSSTTTDVQFTSIVSGSGFTLNSLPH